MPPKHKQPSAANVEEASRWFAFARGDIETARAFLGSTAVPNRNTAYMAQQAAEKAIKAVILLDNMPPALIHEAIALIGGTAVVEVSGGVRYETLRDYALPGVDVISVGALTHSVPAADLSLTILPARPSK